MVKSSSAEPAQRIYRFINHLVDSILSQIFALGFVLVIILSPKFAGLSILDPILDNQFSSFLFFVGLFFFCRLLYYIVFEHFFSKTPGKFISGTAVVSTKGTATLTQLIIRSLARLIPLDDFSIFRSSQRTWHDDLSHTMVVKAKRKRFTDKTSKIMYIFGVITLIVVAVIAYFIISIGVKVATGEYKLGALEVPTVLPEGVKALSVAEKDDDISHYIITYGGDNLEFEYIELTAGYQFDPRQDCVYNQSTGADIGYIEIAEGLECVEIAKTEPKEDYSSRARVYKITATPEFPERQLSKVPEYYIAVAPQRYVIEVTRGTLTDEDVIKMANSLAKLYPEEIIGTD